MLPLADQAFSYYCSEHHLAAVPLASAFLHLPHPRHSLALSCFICRSRLYVSFLELVQQSSIIRLGQQEEGLVGMGQRKTEVELVIMLVSRRRRVLEWVISFQV